MAINSFPSENSGPMQFEDKYIDPVSKFRTSSPENLIDTDFEYGLQPTKWETVEIINNTPAFFSKGGDTTIPDITGITTNGGTREITVSTAFPHGLAVGVPIRVDGTKSITADGSYIINATPSLTSFTYLCRANQLETASIFDLYTSIITGEFFQGSQISISDAAGITTNAEGPVSELTVKTKNKHGFGNNTPFYFLNLNSTISQEFESQNTASVSFDPTNSAVAQTFDGSNTQEETFFDFSNSANNQIDENPIINSTVLTNEIILNQTQAPSVNWANVSVNDAVYYNVSSASGYFSTNPRGVAFIKTISIDEQSSDVTITVSQVPAGDVIELSSSVSGYFQIADQARVFAGNNVNQETQISLDVIAGEEILFDGGNQGFNGTANSPGETGIATILGFDGTTMLVETADSETLNLYVGAMVQYDTDGTVATGLADAESYFVHSITGESGLYSIELSQLPGESSSAISVSGGSGTQTLKKIGVSITKDIVHAENAFFQVDDMVEYTYPVAGTDGNFGADFEKKFYFVETAYDSHNFKLSEDVGFKPIVATGGNSITEVFSGGRTYKVHQFTSTGSSNFVVEDIGEEGNEIQYLVVAAGGAGGRGNSVGYESGGGGAGGVLQGFFEVEATTYPISVGAGVTSANGQNSTAFGLTAIGGGKGGDGNQGGSAGGSGGGGSHPNTAGGAGTPGQGFAGARPNQNSSGGGGGGAGEAGNTDGLGQGGDGIVSSITGTAIYYGGGGAAFHAAQGILGAPGLGGGGISGTSLNGNQAQPGAANTGGGGGGQYASDGRASPAGGSGIVVVRYPITAPPAAGTYVIAEGGTVTTEIVGNTLYAQHAFLTTGVSEFNVISAALLPENNTIEYLIVGGGGSGGGRHGGGGGGGGFLSGTAVISTQAYPVVVGAGGIGVEGNGVLGNNGSPSSFNGLTALGGGGGGVYGDGGATSKAGLTGGSGGGAGYATAPGQGTSGQGFAGGSGTVNVVSTGGGGAGGVGGTANNTAGVGGPGQLWIDGFYYAAGGGGGSWNAGTGGNGGIGGGGGGNKADGGGGSTVGVGGTGGRNNGGNGQYVTNNGVQRFAGSGGANTGSGGGGGEQSGYVSYRGVSGNGGSGIVVIRYPIGTV